MIRLINSPAQEKSEDSSRSAPLQVLRWILFRRWTTTISVLFLVILILSAIFADAIAPYSPTELHYRDALTAPSRQYPLGTDNVGRDQLSRIIYGARSSLLVGAASIALAAVVGISLGLIAGYQSHHLDTLIMRFMDGLLSLPALVLALFMVSILGPSLVNAMIAIGVVFVPSFARITRANTLSLRELGFVQASRASGAKDLAIMIRHILPNTLSPLIVQVTLGISRAILTEASLSFLGLGVQRPAPAWGTMIADGRQFITQAPWTITFPGLAIFLTVLSFNFLGDGLREALDPRLRRSR